MHQLEVTVQKLVGDVATLTQQKTTLETNLQNANLEISQLKSTLHSKTGSGAVYTRWGRKDCPLNGTQLIYSGTVGGGYYNKAGGPSDYICLPHDPNFIKSDGPITTDGYVSSLYGAEYEDGSYFGTNFIDNDVPCAVCRATQQSSVLVIPSKTTCYGSWKVEYYGRLATGADTHSAASQYICIDIAADTLEAGAADLNGKLLYAVKAVCGSLRCPPFYNNAPISCVVCSN
ncbi:short-chain collagen C4-like [Mytilus californianus]|uniref:short-chain collagen C4-like n=1 Tax=Mytilus californianus TaxID=6549 RepID=UPI0022474499|nr:short-chain collagen C4-like [Mytilus californianus]